MVLALGSQARQILEQTLRSFILLPSLQLVADEVVFLAVLAERLAQVAARAEAEAQMEQQARLLLWAGPEPLGKATTADQPLD